MHRRKSVSPVMTPALHDGMDAVAGNSDPLGKLVLTHADLVEKLLFQDLSRMRITKRRHGYTLHLLLSDSL